MRGIVAVGGGAPGVVTTVIVALTFVLLWYALPLRRRRVLARQRESGSQPDSTTSTSG